MGLQLAAKGKNKDRVQRSYFLDRDIDKALRDGSGGGEESDGDSQ